MEHRTFRIYNQRDYERVTSGIKVAQCMRPKLSEDPAPDTNYQLDELTISDSLSCSFCNTVFEDQAQQRSHYKLDWHRYNLKQRLRGFKSIAEDGFNTLVDKDDVSSLSGTESSSTDDYDAVLNKSSVSGGSRSVADTENNHNVKSKSMEKKVSVMEFIFDSSDTDNDEATIEKRKMETRLATASRHSKVFFENSDGEIFSVYRCLLHCKKEIPEFDEDLVKQALDIGNKSLWTIIMVGGGHFAAAIFEGEKIITHKTFHAYTVRAKQGSSQSSRDNRASGHSKSAGASLRRYNEAKLMQHIQEIFESWSTHLANSSLILYRAVGPHNRTILFGGKNPPLDKSDCRLRPLPFPTKRATFSEVQRAYEILSTVEIYGLAIDFTESFPVSPRQAIRKKISKPDEISELKETNVLSDTLSTNKTANSPRSSSELSNIKGLTQVSDRSRNNRPVINRAKPRKSPNRPLPDIIAKLAKSSSESDIDSAVDSNNIPVSISFIQEHCEFDMKEQLLEFEDTEAREQRKKKIRGQRKKSNKQNRQKVSPTNEFLNNTRSKFWSACKIGDFELLSGIWESLQNEIRKCEEADKKDCDDTNAVIIKMNDIIKIINESDEDGNTMLHIAAIRNHLQILWLLLEIGIDPCKKNKKSQTAYAAATNKETRNTFRRFMALNSNKFDNNEVKEISQEELEKKKNQRKLKREREKMKKKEFELKKKEAEAKQRFLNLCDREKRALEAERRLHALSTIISRCFQCGTNITGIISFEYNSNRFCSMPCLKEHRLHNKFIL